MDTKMKRQEARKLASETAVWYFQNGLHLQPQVATLSKQSSSKPKYSSDMWAKLMTEAIISFNEGLELEPEGRRASRDLRDAAVEMVGIDAFRDIAFIVSAAETRRPIEEELEQSFEQMQEQPGGSQISSIQDLANFVTNEMDQYVYGEVSKNKDVNDPQITQSEAHNLTGYLQQVSQTATGISQPFAQALTSLGAAYQIKADELTRSSGFGNVGPGGDTGTSGLPTGVRIGMRLRKSLTRIAARAIYQLADKYDAKISSDGNNAVFKDKNKAEEFSREASDNGFAVSEPYFMGFPGIEEYDVYVVSVEDAYSYNEIFGDG